MSNNDEKKIWYLAYYSDIAHGESTVNAENRLCRYALRPVTSETPELCYEPCDGEKFGFRTIITMADLDTITTTIKTDVNSGRHTIMCEGYGFTYEDVSNKVIKVLKQINISEFELEHIRNYKPAK